MDVVPTMPGTPKSDDMRGSYVRVIIVWILTLAGLYAFQAYFS